MVRDQQRPVTQDEVRRAFGEAFEEVRPLALAEGRTGGVGTFYDRRAKNRFRTKLGKIPKGKHNQYSGNATRKRNVLDNIVAQELDASYTYREPMIEKPVWGGGIRVYRYIVTFSGLPEKVDELFSLIVLWKLDVIKSDEIFQIVGRTENEVALKYFRKHIGMVA